MAFLCVNGCASQIMKSYIGKDVREAVLDYGPPANAIDLGGDKRAFQWVMNSRYTTPVTATTTGSVNSYGPTAWVNTNTTVTGGQRSEEHTSELQSLMSSTYAVFCLKKNKKTSTH